MGVPTSEVGYTPAMPRREDHGVHKEHVGEKNFDCVVKKCLLARARLRRTSPLVKINVSEKRLRTITLTTWRNITFAGGFPIQIT